MNIILFDAIFPSCLIPADDVRAKHIRNILHLRVGDTFRIGEINGVKGDALITCIDAEGNISFVLEHLEGAEPLFPITLLVSQVRPICMKRILREAVSYGVSEIIVTGADLAEKSYAQANMWTTEGYKSYLLDGAMQSSYTGIASVKLIESLDVLQEEAFRWDHKVVLDLSEGAQRLSTWSYTSGEVIVGIGPERGWSDRERTLLHNMGFVSHSMGKRVLRTETACNGALAILLGRMGLL